MMSPRFARPRGAASPGRPTEAPETRGALSRDTYTKIWKSRSPFCFLLRFDCGRGLAGDEGELRFKREAVIQENPHAPRPAEISLRDIRSTDGQHRQNRGIPPAFHEQRGNPFRMNFVGVSDQVWRRWRGRDFVLKRRGHGRNRHNTANRKARLFCGINAAIRQKKFHCLHMLAAHAGPHDENEQIAKVSDGKCILRGPAGSIRSFAIENLRPAGTRLRTPRAQPRVGAEIALFLGESERVILISS